ncbi:hypothetical protein MSG28_001591, partial [Choristoneura fumiferana]
ALAIGYSSGSVHIVDIEDKEILDKYELEQEPSEDGYKNPTSDDNVKDLKEMQEQTQLNMLLVGYGTGHIYMSVFGRYPYGTIHLAQIAKDEFGEFKVLDINLSDDFSMMQVFYLDRTTKSLFVALVNTSVLSAYAEEIFTVANRHSQLTQLLSHLDQTMTSITEAWEHILLEMDTKMAYYAASVPEGGVSADLLELLMLGVPSDELELFLLQELTAKGLKKFGSSILGIEEATVSEAIKACCAFLNKSLELQQGVIDSKACKNLHFSHSTDFEVHRNWLAVTHNLSVSQWYYDTTSEWTLDYPPFFAWLEYVLSFVAKLFDPQMLYLTNLNYASDMTIIFQRLSVIVLDFIYIASAKSCSNLISDGKLLVFILLISNPGLLMVDHIHFQYNGVLYGFLLYSMSNMIRGNFISAAIWFTVLLNLKHIYLYVAPAYFVHLLRAYCFTISTNDGVHTPWYSFSFINLFKVAIAVITIFVLSFGPFIDHIPQIISRLFPFKRGLCHAYWAPNFWALYNFADKVLQHGLPKAGIVVPKVEASMTGGLVQEFEHTVLPSIKPVVTLVLTAVTMLPALIKLWHLGADRNFLSVLGDVDGRLFLILSTVGHYSLFPLLYPKNLLSIKIFMLLTHCAIAFGNIPTLYEPQKPKHKKPKRSFLRLPMLGPFESLYVYGLIVLCVYENLLHTIWGLDKTLPFLPLMLTSVYCGVGVLYFWITYYYYFIYFNVSKVPMLGTGNLTQYTKKIK